MRARLPWFLLAASVLLNVCIVGGFFFALDRREEPRLPGGPLPPIGRELKLTGEQKALRERAKDETRDEWRAALAEMRPLREDLIAEWAKPQPDFARIDQLLDSLSARFAATQKETVRRQHALFMALTPEQQKIYVEQMRRPPRRDAEPRKERP